MEEHQQKEDEQDQEDLDFMYASQKEATLFVIDISKTMLAADGDAKQNTVRHALECAYGFLKYKIIANPRDMVGILLYGTSNTLCPDTYGYSACQNIHLLIELDCPDAPKMKEVKELLENEDHFREICTPAQVPPTLTNILFLANGMFSQKCPSFNSKRILLITDEDDPHKSDKSVRQAAVTRARDLNDLGIRIEPIFVSSRSKPFDSRKFYDDIIFKDDDELADNLDLLQEGELRFQQMMDCVKAKVSQKRAVFNIPLEIGPGLSIGIKGYVMYKEQKISKSAYVYNLGETPQFAKPETTNVCVDTSKVLEKTDIKRAFRFGNEKVAFEEDELKKIKFIEEPVLRMIGLKSFDQLEFWHSIRPAYFIYPHEATVVGSTRVFAALHGSLLRKNRWALGWFIPRKNANPTMVAMVASRETIAESSKLQIVPPGIFLITLPFADDIRKNPMLMVSKSPDELTDKMMDVVRYLKLGPYDPFKYQNPALQWHWRTLQALALEEDMPEDKIDVTLPKFKGIEKRAGPSINEWLDCFDRVKEDVMSTEPSKKRMGESQTAAQATKKHKIHSPQTTIEDLRRAIENDHLDKLTLPLLKQVLKDFPESFTGRPAGMRKADYITFITTQLQ